MPLDRLTGGVAELDAFEVPLLEVAPAVDVEVLVGCPLETVVDAEFDGDPLPDALEAVGGDDWDPDTGVVAEEGGGASLDGL